MPCMEFELLWMPEQYLLNNPRRKIMNKFCDLRRLIISSVLPYFIGLLVVLWAYLLVLNITARDENVWKLWNERFWISVERGNINSFVQRTFFFFKFLKCNERKKKWTPEILLNNFWIIRPSFKACSNILYNLFVQLLGDKPSFKAYSNVMQYCNELFYTHSTFLGT